MNIGTITITVYLDDNGEEMTSVSVTGDHFPLITQLGADRPGTGFAAAAGGGPVNDEFLDYQAAHLCYCDGSRTPLEDS